MKKMTMFQAALLSAACCCVSCAGAPLARSDPLVLTDHQVDLVLTGTPEKLSELISGGTGLAAVDGKGRTMLHIAAMDLYYPAKIDILLKENPDVDIRDDEGNSPLFYAASSTIIEKFLAAGSDIDARNKLGATPLIHMCDCKAAGDISQATKDLVISLVGHGADVNIKDTQGKRAVDYLRENKGVNLQTKKRLEELLE